MKKTITTLLIIISNIISAQTPSTSLLINDTRSLNDLPNFIGGTMRADFKERVVIGVPGSGAYSTNVTFAPWGTVDNSGNKNHQLNFNNGGVFYRNANPTDTQWGAWRSLLISDVNGNFGIGTDTPLAKLDVYGELLLGSTTSTNGVNAFSIRYSGNETLSNWGSLMSSGATYMAYGAKANPAVADGWLSATSNNILRSSVAVSNAGISFLTAPAQTTALNATLAMTEIVRINNSGIGVGTIDPKSKLDLGDNYSNPSTFPNKITLWSGGANNYFGFGISENDLDYLSQGNHRFYTGYNGSPGTEKMVITTVGNVGIGVVNPQYKLDVAGKSSFSDNMAVQGKIESKEIKVTTTPTADFVFESDYALPTLESVEKHIKEKKHLPEIASAKEMEKEGVNVGEFQIKLLQKIEELTLYAIEQNKKILEQSKKIERLEKKVNSLK